MGRNLLLTLFTFTLLAVGLAPQSVRAHSLQQAVHTHTHEVCSAPAGSAIESVPAKDWKCETNTVDLDAPRNIVRLDVAAGSNPRFIISRTAKFSEISVGVVTGGLVTWNTVDFDNVNATFFDRQFYVPLPEYEGEPLAVLVAVDRATQETTFDHLRLENELPGSSNADIALLLVVALFTGMMLMPILFDFVFYRILREKFILWHAALVACLAMQLVFSFGLHTAFIDVSLPAVRVLTIGSFLLMTVSGVMFTVRFVEPDRLPRRLKIT